MSGGSPSRSLRVLYADDEPDIREIVALALSLDPLIECHVVESGHEALREAPAFAPDVIMLDVMMPGMDGPTTLAAMRAIPSLRDVPAIFCTARAQSLESLRSDERHAVGVISKPFDPMRLAAQVRELLGV